jgi:hypothetical protein
MPRLAPDLPVAFRFVLVLRLGLSCGHPLLPIINVNACALLLIHLYLLTLCNLKFHIFTLSWILNAHEKVSGSLELCFLS